MTRAALAAGAAEAKRAAAPPLRPERRQLGFGLVELMVALALGMLLVAMAVQVLIGQRTSQRFTQALSTVQVHARFALYILERDLRRAGYGGCVVPATQAPFVRDHRPYGALNILAAETAIRDWRDFALAVARARNENIPDSANSASNVLRLGYVRDPGVRVTAPANSRSEALQISGNPAGWEQGDQLLVTNCRAADLFIATGVSGSTIAHAATNPDGRQNTRAAFSRLYGDDARVFEPVGVIYYIRDSGEGRRQAPTLYRKRVAPTVEYSQALVKGISRLTLRYAVDRNGTVAPDAYLGASAVADWRRVIAVRIGFVAESLRPVGADAGGTLRIFDRRLDALPDDGRLRRVFTTTVALRNQLP